MALLLAYNAPGFSSLLILAATMVADQTNGSSHTNGASKQQLIREPLVYSGGLDTFKSFDVTTIIGREFPDVQLTNLMRSPDADRLFRDLAITSEYQYKVRVPGGIYF